MNPLWDDYLQWLIWRCGLEHEKHYGRLFEALHDIPFIYCMDRDENREIDGMDLREQYEIPDCSNAVAEDFYAQKCSVMEMLVALSIRVDDDIVGDPGEEHPEDFFMEMIRNLGLDRFKQNRCRRGDVDRIVDRWMKRDFGPDGAGSPFPIHDDPRDQRDLEIWDQVNSYINENYD